MLKASALKLKRSTLPRKDTRNGIQGLFPSWDPVHPLQVANHSSRKRLSRSNLTQQLSQDVNTARPLHRTLSPRVHTFVMGWKRTFSGIQLDVFLEAKVGRWHTGRERQKQRKHSFHSIQALDKAPLSCAERLFWVVLSLEENLNGIRRKRAEAAA